MTNNPDDALYPSPYFVFGEKLRTKAVAAKQLTMVEAIHLAIFGSNLVTVANDISTLDSWLDLRLSFGDAAIIGGVREAVSQLLSKAASKPESVMMMDEEDNKLIEVVVKLCCIETYPGKRAELSAAEPNTSYQGRGAGRGRYNKPFTPYTPPAYQRPMHRGYSDPRPMQPHSTPRPVPIYNEPSPMSVYSDPQITPEYHDPHPMQSYTANPMSVPGYSNPHPPAYTPPRPMDSGVPGGEFDSSYDGQEAESFEHQAWTPPGRPRGSYGYRGRMNYSRGRGFRGGRRGRRPFRSGPRRGRGNFRGYQMPPRGGYHNY